MECSSCSICCFLWYNIAATEAKHPHTKQLRLNSCVLEGLLFLALPVVLVVLLLNDINIIWYGYRVRQEFAKINTINIKITWTICTTNGSKYEMNTVLNRKSQRTSHHGTKKVNTCSMITWTTRVPQDK
jgi:hypothetical protein